MIKLIRVLTLAAMQVPAVLLAANNDLAVVVNKGNSASDLTKSQLRKLVLGEQGSWPGGEKVTVILRAPGSPERDGLLRTVCRMNEGEYRDHMMHAASNGEVAAARIVLVSSAEVLQFVAKNPGAIGFLRVSDVNNSVKVASVDGASAGGADYQIKAGK